MKRDERPIECGVGYGELYHFREGMLCLWRIILCPPAMILGGTIGPRALVSPPSQPACRGEGTGRAWSVTVPRAYFVGFGTSQGRAPFPVRVPPRNCTYGSLTPSVKTIWPRTARGHLSPDTREGFPEHEAEPKTRQNSRNGKNVRRERRRREKQIEKD